MAEDPYLTPEERRHLRRQEKEARAKEAQDDAVVQSLMSTPAGRAWVRELLEQCHVFHASFTGEALGSAFREGERSIGLRLLAAVMRAHPEAYVQMMKESNYGGPAVLDRRDFDDPRNYDDGGRWIGDGDGPDE